MAWLMKRCSVYYIRYCVGSKKRKVSTDTDNYQLAKEKLRQSEAARTRGDVSPLPTKTPIAEVLTAYVAHIEADYLERITTAQVAAFISGQVANRGLARRPPTATAKSSHARSTGR